MKEFRTLEVWKYAHEFVKMVYKSTKFFPTEETYGLTSQLRRAAVSIPNNLAEGCGRNSDKELKRFVVIASGSANECDYLLLLAYELQYISKKVYEFLKNELHR